VKIKWGIILGILLLPVWLSGQQQNVSIFNIPVTLTTKDKPLDQVLNEISRKANIFFSYDATEVVSDRLISIDIQNQPVITVLNTLFDHSLFSFIEKENQIIITIDEEEEDEEIVASEQNIPTPEPIVISGRIIDEKNKFPIRYAGVSVYDKPVGTITNDEGEFILKIKPDLAESPIIFSCLGYARKMMTIEDLSKNPEILLRPISIQLKEISVKAITAEELLNNVFSNLSKNYGNDLFLMKAFYRETLKQDGNYINVSEAVIEILKSEYLNFERDDKIRIVKGRKSPDVNAFLWVNFKLMGGPRTITKLDILKTMDSFIDPEYRNLYHYTIDRAIMYRDRPVLVVSFKPVKNIDLVCFEGEIYIDRESYAILHVDFGFTNQGLRIAEQSLIKKKPKDFKVHPTKVLYTVDYRLINGMYYFNTAKASMEIKIKNRSENFNSTFNSVSEILVTDLEKSQIKKFPRNQVFDESDIFTENIHSFHEEFFGNYNIFKPDDDLKTAIEDRLKMKEKK
jgi:hypothetical protein